MEILAVSEISKNLVLCVSYGIPKMAIFANFVKLHFLTSSKRFGKKKKSNFLIAASDKSQKKQRRNLKNDRISYFVQLS